MAFTLRPSHVPQILLTLVLVILIGAYLTRSDTPPTQEPGTMQVSASDPGWPLNMPGGLLKCSGNAVTLTTDQGTVYALNGNARGRLKENGWRDSQPYISGNISPLIAKGLALCQQ